MDHRAHPLSARAASRRRFLTTAATGAAALTTSLLVPNLAMTAKSMPATRSLAFRSLHTGEEVAATYLRDGIFQADALDRLNHVLRDWRSGEVWQMDRKLLDLLYALLDPKVRYA